MKLTILQGLLHPRVYHNNTLSKGFLTSFLDKETDSQKGHLLRFTLLSGGWKHKTIHFHSCCFCSTRGFQIGFPGAQDKGRRLGIHPMGRVLRRKAALLDVGSLCSFQAEQFCF